MRPRAARDRQRTAESLAPLRRRVSVKTHAYDIVVTWPAHPSEPTANYRSYRRDHTIERDGKPAIPASSDPAFRGDSSRYNPEELLVASLSSCHMLWFLHLCAVNGVTVLGYRDEASGLMEEHPEGGGAFVRVTLHPRVTLAPQSDAEKANALHHEAHRLCFIARSVNFPVEIEPAIS
ncbi:MAG: OsmC family protein [Candidatus Eremiobacteraeota bacterium]|nr:OsmC family protein [Candidatus Eremiobacteraeota bacterium]